MIPSPALNCTNGSHGLFVCLYSFICIPLHAAQRAMAAARRCPHGQQRFSNTLHDQNPIPNHYGSYWGIPISFSPIPPEKIVKDQGNKTKEKKENDSLGWAWPTLFTLCHWSDAFSPIHIHPSHSTGPGSNLCVLQKLNNCLSSPLSPQPPY